VTVAPPTPPPAIAAEAAAPGHARILTGEAVHLDVRAAGLGSRALARLADLLVQVVLFWVLSALTTFVLLLLATWGLIEVDNAIFTAALIVTIVATLVGYPVMMETLTRGRTLGKLIFGLRVVRDDGGPVTFRQALTRSLVALSIEFPGLLFPPLTWLVAIWVMIASPRNQRLGDQVAGTLVIHERTPAAWGWVPAMPPALAMWAATLDLTGLDDDLALAVRSFLARNRSLREPARSALGERLVREVASVTNPPPPPGTPAWMYLAAVHAERHRRAMQNLAAVRTRAATVWPELAAAIAAPPPPPPPPPRRGTPAAPAFGAAPPGAAGPAAPAVPTVRPAQPNNVSPQ
jgi:uncharacterized RDD family membrane protein YckC